MDQSLTRTLVKPGNAGKNKIIGRVKSLIQSRIKNSRNALLTAVKPARPGRIISSRTPTSPQMRMGTIRSTYGNTTILPTAAGIAYPSNSAPPMPYGGAAPLEARGSPPYLWMLLGMGIIGVLLLAGFRRFTRRR